MAGATTMTSTRYLYLFFYLIFSFSLIPSLLFLGRMMKVKLTQGRVGRKSIRRNYSKNIIEKKLIIIIIIIGVKKKHKFRPMTKGMK